MPQAPEQIEVQSLDDYLEVMSKAVFQSGMSWKVVEAKWPTTREAFQNFDVKKVADFSPFDIEALTKDTRVIRNRRKLEAIVFNAQKEFRYLGVGIYQEFLFSSICEWPGGFIRKKAFRSYKICVGIC